jgi:hypothetical protein
MSLIRVLAPLGVTVLATSILTPQTAATQVTTPEAARRAAETITEAGFRARLETLAHDSMRGRDTPSPELLEAADWVASEFRRIGLTPAGDDGTFLQDVPLRRSRLDTASIARVSAPGMSATWHVGRDVALPGGAPSEGSRSLPMVLLAGMPSDLDAPFGDVSVRDRAVLFVAPPGGLTNSTIGPLLATATAEGAAALVVATMIPAPQWEQMAGGAFTQEQWGLAESMQSRERDGLAILLLQDSTVAPLLAAAGEDLAQVLAPEGHGVRVLEGAELTLDMRHAVSADIVVPNVVGMLEGSDPALRDQAVVFVAHMDHVGVAADGRCGVVGADSVCNGANDNASGTIGVIELAEAFASLQPRPRRTTIFVAVAAEERGLLGAYHYTEHPAIPIEHTVAAINFDMIVRNAPDSIILVAKSYSSLGPLADRMAADHPELNVVPANDPAIHDFVFQSSDHYPFAVAGVPVLFFFSGLHDDLHAPTDDPGRADCDKGARVARLAFYIGLEVANANERPTWDPDARARVVQHE